MPKVGFLIGISGTGKGYVSKSLAKEAEVVEFDGLRDKALARLFPDGRIPSDLWNRWDAALEQHDVSSVISDLFKLNLPALSNDRPLLAEGIDLAHNGVRGAFRAALIARGIEITEERVFWLDPPAEVVKAHRGNRGRANQQTESLEAVKQHRQYYAERIGHDVVYRYEASDDLLRVLREFLFGPSV